MHWYYEENGVQVGPFTELQFEDCVRMGKIRGDTLVWRDGMAGWQPYATVSGGTPAPVPAPPFVVSRALNCSQCGRSFVPEDMIRHQNLWICASCKDVFFQRMREGLAPGGTAMWRDNTKLVVGRDAQLPDRCVKCNAPANGNRLVKKMYWHPQAYYLLICVGFIFYIIAALIVRKQATVAIGLCQTHLKKRKTAILVTWSLVALAFALFFIAAGADVGALAGVGGLLLLAAMIYGAIAVPTVAPTKIDDRFVWLKGVNSQFLASLPEYTVQKYQ
jgi:hypothetical protein